MPICVAILHNCSRWRFTSLFEPYVDMWRNMYLQWHAYHTYLNIRLQFRDFEYTNDILFVRSFISLVMWIHLCRYICSFVYIISVYNLYVLFLFHFSMENNNTSFNHVHHHHGWYEHNLYSYFLLRFLTIIHVLRMFKASRNE